jgi:hypothetical protein
VTISDIRKGLGTNLNTIAGLRVTETIPDNFSPPIAVISLSNINYDEAFQRGMTQYNFVVSVIVGRVAEREAQRRLDAYASNGSASVKLAIESDRSLGSAAYDVRVSEMTNIGAVLLGGDVTYLAADFAVSVYAE